MGQRARWAGQRPWLGHGGQDRLVGAWCKKPLKLAASRVSSVEAAAPDKAARLLGQAGCWTTAVRSQHESVVCTCTTPTELAASIIIHTTVSTASLRLNATVRSTNENLSTTAGGDEDWATTALVRAASAICGGGSLLSLGNCDWHAKVMQHHVSLYLRILK